MNARHAGAATGILTALLLIAAAPWPGGFRHIEAAPGFEGWRAELQRLVDAEGPSGPNRFCVVVGGADPKQAQAYVLWRSRRSLITWGASREPISALSQAGQPLDLRRDVVARERDLHGSTYRVTRAWVAGIEDGCRRFGTTLTLRKQARP